MGGQCCRRLPGSHADWTSTSWGHGPPSVLAAAAEPWHRWAGMYPGCGQGWWDVLTALLGSLLPQRISLTTQAAWARGSGSRCRKKNRHTQSETGVLYGLSGVFGRSASQLLPVGSPEQGRSRGRCGKQPPPPGEALHAAFGLSPAVPSVGPGLPFRVGLHTHVQGSQPEAEP